MTIQQKLESIRIPIMDKFEMRSVPVDEFSSLFDECRPLVFAGVVAADIRSLFSAAENEALAALRSYMGSPTRLNLGLFHGEKFIGWHCGDQKSGEEFYMRNTGILPEYQGRGIYTAMLRKITAILTDIGFQVISSKHNATNNRVIVPKLKAGFMITGLDISDRFGTMVRLEYFTNAKRRALIDFRSGFANPSAELKEILGI